MNAEYQVTRTWSYFVDGECMRQHVKSEVPEITLKGIQ